MNVWLTLPLVFALNSFVNWNDPQTLMLFRGVFVTFAILQYMVWNNLKTKIEELPDDSMPVWVKEAKPAGIQSLLDGFLGGGSNEPPKYKRTTYKELEKERATQQAQQTIMGPIIQLAMSLYMGIQLPIAMACVTGPLGLYQDPTVQRHYLGARSFTEADATAPNRRDIKPGVYGELPFDPSAPTAAPSSSGSRIANSPTSPSSPAASSDSTVAQAGDASQAVADDLLEEAIFRCWESEEPAPIGLFEGLREQGKDVAGYQTVDNGWSALMVVAGSPQNARKEVITLLEMGCKATARDNDGWTALHWAAFHGNANAATVIVEGHDGASVPGATNSGKKRMVVSLGGHKELASLLAMRNEAGLTALELAEREGNATVVRVLRAAWEGIAPAIRAGVEKSGSGAVRAKGEKRALPSSLAADGAASVHGSVASASSASVEGDAEGKKDQ